MWEQNIQNTIHRAVKPYDQGATLAHAVIDIARPVIDGQRQETDRLDAVIDELAAERDRLQAALAQAYKLLVEAGPLIGASSGWPGRRAAWLEANRP